MTTYRTASVPCNTSLFLQFSTMSRKRTIEEVDNINDVDKTIPNSSLCGTLTSLSPMKPGRNSSYFEGTLADYTSKIRFVGFETFQQRKLSELFEQKATVKLMNCEVKKARSGDGYELLLKRYTIAEIESLNMFDKVTIHAKVVKVNSLSMTYHIKILSSQTALAPSE